MSIGMLEIVYPTKSSDAGLHSSLTLRGLQKNTQLPNNKPVAIFWPNTISSLRVTGLNMAKKIMKYCFSKRLQDAILTSMTVSKTDDKYKIQASDIQSSKSAPVINPPNSRRH